ncbi:NAD(P)/FAD-dependent oxidoreductase [Agrobacterium vitis]|uniref:NAD(P)/FAD-dependent oxidoreductase n=1 Tax=Agrobacterium vitis TaxID=373 RepID=UPI001F3B4B4E|nr:FAD-binding oxidoreductase [Agrobacterium vitis]
MPSLSLLQHAPEDAVAALLDCEKVLPKDADAVIVGGGIMGCSAAWYLAKAGLNVALLDKGRLASQQSGRNWGFVRSLCRDPLELPLAALALEMWPTAEAELGFRMGWRRSGCVFLSADEAEHAAYGKWQTEASHLVRDTRLLDTRETKQRFPALTQPAHGAIIAESDGQAEPTLATLAYAKAAMRAGASVLEDCGVVAIEKAGGRVCGVQTEYGSIRTPLVICTAGARTYRLISDSQPGFPQKVVRSTVSLTAPMADLKLPCFVGYGLGLRQRADGSCIIATDSGTDVDVTLDSFRAGGYFLRELWHNRKSFSLQLGKPLLDDVLERFSVPRAERAIHPKQEDIPPNQKRVRKTAQLFSSLFGAEAPPKIVKSWAGNIDVMPDALPVIDGSGPVSGLIVATGFSGHGFGLGPAVGRTIADLSLGRTLSVDLSPFAASRFARGAYSRPYTTI